MYEKPPGSPDRHPNGAGEAIVLSRPYLLAQAAVLAAVLALFLSILWLNGGTFTYTLDDAYIHLAVSEQIARGGYGVNAGETCAASSSVLYPLLLAPAAPFAWHALCPLLINTAALLLSVDLLFRYLAGLGLMATPRARVFSAAAVVLAAVQLNLVGLVFTGLEHSLHCLVVVAMLHGLTVFLEPIRKGVRPLESRGSDPFSDRLLETSRVPWWLVAAIALGPLVRYEAAAASLAAAGVMAWRGAWRWALGSVAVCLAGLVGFSLFLVSSGLSPLPSSVLVKSGIANSGIEASAGALAGGLFENLKTSLLKERPGILLGGFCVALVVALLASRAESQAGSGARRLFIAFTLAAVGAHLLAGRYGWFHRYEVYALLLAAAASLYIWKDAIRDGVERLALPATLACCTVVLGFVGSVYTYRTFLVPLAANNVYEQHCQIHRFATQFWRDDVAVNDLGRAAYRNPYYVLDLWGLGSEQVRRARERGITAADLVRLVRQRGVGLAMIYQSWFGRDVPPEWTLVGRIYLGHRRVTPPEDHVEFYATCPAAVPELAAKLEAFRRTLPEGVRLQIIADAVAARESGKKRR